ncbi:FUSC family protein [Streptomyces venezuelae]|uniref:FUSC family protein n=1 Tax=Streptomyces venezuelae TaxID=54571 RepID=A0A5P2CV69_STRVZ|nr:FUSC family protein [Streptomyces venezuelae]QES46745.1 FUSC family protein [Streptomyces venezuelae]
MLYGFGQTIAATYALFAAVSLAGLSRIPGTGRQRAAAILRLVPACWLLVVIGTFLAVSTWTAVAGMLVIGFALAFIAVGGPRPAGAAPGLQLLYILPCFPPYAPDTLDERLIGATLGIGLLILAEAYLFPDPPGTSYRQLAARAADTAARCADELSRPPYALTAAARQAARDAGQALRPSRVPDADRPAGPSVRERALAHTGLATRTLLDRLSRLPAPPPGSGPAPPGAGTGLLHDIRQVAAESAVTLRGEARSTTSPGEARTALLRSRAAIAAPAPAPAAGPSDPPAALRRQAALIELADAALTLSTGTGIAVRGRAAAAGTDPGRFWYAHLKAPQLWWRRLIGHAGRRSVFFQNAVRISLALAAARAVAGLDTLPHGFWAMLATLTLTRTTVTETRTTIRNALIGTLLGALVAALVLTLVGTHTTVYAVALPLLMLSAFTLGPVKGVGWAQGLFTLVVALAFAQLAPATWQLAELRVVDVFIGSAIGAVFGLLAWPRGAHEELRRSVAVLLRSTAEVAVATTAAVVAGGPRQALPPPAHRSVQHDLILAESAFAQYQIEPVGARTGLGGPGSRPMADWQAALMAGHHTLWGARRLLTPPGPPPGETGTPAPPPAPPLESEAAVTLMRLGERVAAGMLLTAAALDPAPLDPGVEAPAPDPATAATGPPGAGFDAEPPGAPREFYAAVSWLGSLAADLDGITASLRSAPGRADGQADGQADGRADGQADGQDAAQPRSHP